MKANFNKPNFRSSQAGFTLIELMAVVVILIMLGGITLTMVNYVQSRATISYARAQLASIETALEAYKADWGFYPASRPARFSSDGTAEATNNWYMYSALTGTSSNGPRKVYIKFRPTDVGLSLCAGVPVIRDPWGTPYNYYYSPGTPSSFITTNGVTIAYGGQHNSTAFDLFSFGPDRFTYMTGTGYSYWSNPIFRIDDICNWAQ